MYAAKYAELSAEQRERLSASTFEMYVRLTETLEYWENSGCPHCCDNPTKCIYGGVKALIDYIDGEAETR